ncbi:unnamed protein product [Lymnaea stagnalis]|uniref:Uncharacterized protein n=1 Tax=Lymnaea stagnalis TaxID=6523 RepID=A0AAV2H8V3_LYMST
MACDESVSDTQPATTAQPLPTTPVRIPFENLPFSPSQFLNSPSHSSRGKLTSTPMSSQASYGHSHSNGGRESSPRTPTPFKHAIAEVERRAQSKTWSPSDLDDLGEVLKDCDAGYEADISSGLHPTSQTRLSKRKPNKEVDHVKKKIPKKSAKKIMFTDSPLKPVVKVQIIDPTYRKVACGLTKDQLDMIQLAKNYLQGN